MNKEKLQKVETYTEDKEEYIQMIEDGAFYITEHFHLMDEDELANYEAIARESPKRIVGFVIGNPEQTTYRLRQWFAINHKHLDFDKELDTHSPGVFYRYKEKFGEIGYAEFCEWKQKKVFDELEQILFEKGYKLTFSNREEEQIKALLDTFEENLSLIKEQSKMIHNNMSHLFWDMCVVKQTYYQSIGEEYVCNETDIEAAIAE